MAGLDPAALAYSGRRYHRAASVGTSYRGVSSRTSGSVARALARSQVRRRW
ncbi:MAG: hypothetical protein ACREA2_20895 [Blastocatellia bacterium]